MANFDFNYDRNATAQHSLDISEVSFSDAYTHRMARSINPKRSKWNLSFKNRDYLYIKQITDFLEDNSVYTFKFVEKGCPDPVKTHTVTCKEWNTSVVINGIQSLTCVFISEVL